METHYPHLILEKTRSRRRHHTFSPSHPPFLSLASSHQATAAQQPCQPSLMTGGSWKLLDATMWEFAAVVDFFFPFLAGHLFLRPRVLPEGLARWRDPSLCPRAYPWAPTKAPQQSLIARDKYMHQFPSCSEVSLSLRRSEGQIDWDCLGPGTTTTTHTHRTQYIIRLRGELYLSVSCTSVRKHRLESLIFSLCIGISASASRVHYNNNPCPNEGGAACRSRIWWVLACQAKRGPAFFASSSCSVGRSNFDYHTPFAPSIYL